MICANYGEMFFFFKIRQKEFRNADTSHAYWTTKNSSSDNGVNYSKFACYQ